MNDRVAQLILETHKGQAQFAYFQLGVAASAMAFAVHETADTPLSEAPWPLGVAMVLWAASFALGCFGLEARQGGLASNAALLQAIGGVPPEQRGPLAETIDQAKTDVEKNLSRPGRRFRWQKWTLFFGAIAYVAGHVMHMASIPTKPNSVHGPQAIHSH